METYQGPEYPTQKPPKSTKINISLDPRIIIVVLLLVIGGMLFAWKPWEAKNGEQNDRVISVSGESKVTAEPDEFVFYPSYEFKNSKKEVALADLTKKSEEIVAKLKELGVPDSKIKTDSDGYNYGYYYDRSSSQNNYSLRLTVTAESREMAEKVQTYLVSTAPTGNVSPQASFSDKKRKELETQARDEATKDARSKADQSAKNLGFKVGSVKSIKDGNGLNGGFDRLLSGANELSMAAPDTGRDLKLSVQPGENDLTYSVEVVYYVK